MFEFLGNKQEHQLLVEESTAIKKFGAQKEDCATAIGKNWFVVIFKQLLQINYQFSRITKEAV